jgi:orotate phosphoribosyltransferase
VKKIIAVIDREEGGRKNIEDKGFVFEAIFTRSDLGLESS